jgi:hypothetical protein
VAVPFLRAVPSKLLQSLSTCFPVPIIQSNIYTEFSNAVIFTARHFNLFLMFYMLVCWEKIPRRKGARQKRNKSKIFSFLAAGRQGALCVTKLKLGTILPFSGKYRVVLYYGPGQPDSFYPQDSKNNINLKKILFIN